MERGSRKRFSSAGSEKMEREMVADRKKMEGHYSTGQRTRRDEQRRKYNKMDKRAKDKLVRSPRENGGG